MAEPNEPKITQTVTLGSGNRIVYKSDGKSYYQVVSNGRVVSESVVTSSQAQRRIEQDPPRQTTTPIERLTPDQLRSVIRNMESLRPNAQGRYVYQGQTLTEGALDQMIKRYQDRLSELESISRRSGEQASQPDPGVDQEVRRVNQIRTNLSQKIQDIKDEIRTVTTVGGQNNLTSWANYYQAQFDRLTKYVDDLSNGRVRVGSVDTAFTNVTIEQATARPTAGGAAPQPGVEYGGVPGAGQPLPAGSPNMAGGSPFTPQPGQGVFGGEANIPVGVAAPEGTSTTPATTTTASTTTAGTTGTGTTTRTGGTGGTGAGTPAPAPAPAPAAGPAFVDPQTGATVQPGQQIGGPDRALPNGGAVVNGVYIPPGIDYTWLGQQIPQDWESAAKELYGAYYEMVKQYPELGTLLKNAIQQGWSDDKFQYELEQTNWWKTTSANARSWETLQIQDPASAQVQLDNRIALLTDTAQRLGISLSAESLAKIAEDSIKLGLELTSQLENIVGAEALRSSGTVTQLRFGFVGQSIRETARKYGVSLSDVTFNEWVNKIAVGAESVETFDAYANQIARTLYPTLQSGFDRGLSFGQMTDPYAQVASRLLEIPTSQMDFTDPKWAQAFTMKNDKGEQVPMSYSEWADYVRTNPSFGYEYTDEAVNKAYTVVTQLAELFGKA